MADDQYCLKWNNHQSTLLSVLTNLMDSERLADCVLFTEGRMIKAHQVVISACSPYLEKLLNESRVTPGGTPILIFSDLTFDELSAMKEYMYRGEVNIRQDSLDSFLKAANSLQIKGLTDGGGGGDEGGGGGGKRKAEPAPDPGRRRKRRESKESDASHEDEPPKPIKRQQVFSSKVEPYDPQPVVKMEPAMEAQTTVHQQPQVAPQVMMKPEPQDHHEPETHDLTGLDDDDYEEYEMPGPSQSDLSQDMSNWQMENSMNSEDFAASQTAVMNTNQPGQSSQVCCAGPPAGWNDPPMFSYESRVQGAQSSRLTLTKRVSFPQASSPLATAPTLTGPPPTPVTAGPPQASSPLATAPTLTGPPPAPVTAGPPPRSSRPLDSAGCGSSARDMDTSSSPPSLSDTPVRPAVSYQLVHSNLQPRIDHIAAHSQREAADISRRLEALQSQWGDATLSSAVQHKILHLSQAVRDNDARRGLELQRGLMVDHGVVCARWLPAIRHLLTATDSNAITDSTATADSIATTDSTATTDSISPVDCTATVGCTATTD